MLDTFKKTEEINVAYKLNGSQKWRWPQNQDDLKNEDNIKNEDNLKNEDDLKNEEGQWIEFPNIYSSLLIPAKVAKGSLQFNLKLLRVGSARLGTVQ